MKEQRKIVGHMTLSYRGVGPDGHGPTTVKRVPLYAGPGYERATGTGKSKRQRRKSA
ncbi:MAG: hypothetical protein IT462_04005 [Planctomycetes bacterium]|nr:hypothetical protein [Planctomycetota bacterium]